MNILLITVLYPGYPGQPYHEVPYVVHHIAKNWISQHEVRVIRLWKYLPKPLRILDIGKKRQRYATHDSFVLDGVQVDRVPVEIIPRYGCLRRIILETRDDILEILGNFKPDLIQVDMLNPAIYIAQALQEILPCKLFASLHNSDIHYLSKPWNYKRFSSIDNDVSHILLRSRKVERKFFPLYKGSLINKRVSYLPFGIDPCDMMDEVDLYSKAAKRNGIICTVCSLIKLKNVDTLIRAFSNMKAERDIKLWIVGDGPERENLQDLAQKSGCSDSIFFYGALPRTEVITIMREAQIFAMVSAPETFGLVYIEAMANGCLPIGSIGEGIDGVIHEGDNGFLCKPKDISGLRTKLEQALSQDDKQRKTMVLSAYATAKAHFNTDIANKILKLAQSDKGESI